MGGLDDGAGDDKGYAGFCVPDLAGEVRVQGGGGWGVREGVSVAGVEVAFAGEVFGQKDRVAGEFDVEVGDGFGLLPGDCGFVDEIADGDENAVDIEGVVL